MEEDELEDGEAADGAEGAVAVKASGIESWDIIGLAAQLRQLAQEDHPKDCEVCEDGFTNGPADKIRQMRMIEVA